MQIMQEKQVYEYAVIRLVPRVEREEFINIGILLYCKKGQYLEMKYLLDKERLASFAGQIDLLELAQYLNAWDLISQGSPQGGKIAQLAPAERFRWLSASKSTILQCSKVHTGLSSDPALVLERLFTQYVL